MSLFELFTYGQTVFKVKGRKWTHPKKHKKNKTYSLNIRAFSTFYKARGFWQLFNIVTNGSSQYVMASKFCETIWNMLQLKSQNELLTQYLVIMWLATIVWPENSGRLWQDLSRVPNSDFLFFIPYHENSNLLKRTSAVFDWTFM